MIDVIGINAGKLWEYLKANGPASPSVVEKALGLPKNDLQRAIGWLSKEDKLFVDVVGKVETLSLK